MFCHEKNNYQNKSLIPKNFLTHAEEYLEGVLQQQWEKYECTLQSNL